MKRLVALLLISMSFLSLVAEERNIKLNLKKIIKGPRSIVYTPTVTHDGNIFSIYSDILLENLQVAITDLSTGATFYFNHITVFPNQSYSFILDDIEGGTYKIELNVGQQSYYGLFDLLFF